MLEFIKTIFKTEKETKYFAEFRVNGKYRKIELSKMQSYKATIQVGIFVLKIESYREEQTKDTIEVIYECTYVTTKY